MSNNPQQSARTLTGKVALITGSTGGIGAAAAKELSRRGANIVLHYHSQREEEATRETQSKLATDVESILVQADLSTLEGPTSLVQTAVAKFKKIDILVNNAAAFAPGSPVAELTLVDFDRVVNVNIRGTLLVTQATLKYLSRQDSRIVNVSSANASEPIPGITLYSASKAAVDSFTRTWAKELPREYGCTVNGVAPGPINTEAIANAPSAFKAIVSKYAQETPVAPRMGEADEVGWIVATLCEPKASWINGVRVSATGGLNLW